MTEKPETAALEAIAERVLKKWVHLELPKAVDDPYVTSAQRFLSAAADTVLQTLITFRLTREFTKAIDKKDARGRLSNSEMDILRATIVFAGAGLDTTLKELIRCALPALIPRSDLAREKFERFAAEHLGSRQNVLNIENLAVVLTSAEGARGALLSSYGRALTGDSLQSASQVSNVAGALGIVDTALRKRVAQGSKLDQMFRARNEIVHELDVLPKGVRFRKIETTAEWVVEALSVGQEFINDVARQLRAA